MYASSGSSQMKTNKSRNCPIKRERMERLKRRMATYRERSNYQRKLQIWREENLQKNEDAVGFNLFCKEFEPSDKNNNKNTLSSAEVLEFNESYFETCSSSVHPTDHFQTKESCLCWICGGMFQSKNQLRQHAVDDHFSDWLASMTLFELDEMLKLSIKCPKCTRVFLEIHEFNDHVMREHEGLSTWLQFNGFDLSD